MPKDTLPRPTPVQALTRAFDLLDTLAAGDRPLAELARLTGQPVSTTHRLMTALAARGMAFSDPTTQLWSLGPATLRLGAAYLARGGLEARAAPILTDLARATGETAALVTPDGTVIAAAPSPQPVRACLDVGEALPADSAFARALCAATSTDPDAPRIRQRGFATQDGPRDLRALAAPVRNARGATVAALGITGPAHRIAPEHLKTLGAAVSAAAARLSEALGADPEGTVSPPC